MFDKFPCFRIKRRNANGQTSEIEIRPSLLRWLIIFVVVLAFLIRGGDPAQLFRNLLNQPSLHSVPLSGSVNNEAVTSRTTRLDFRRLIVW